jgi:hypothetical protein
VAVEAASVMPPAPVNRMVAAGVVAARMVAAAGMATVTPGVRRAGGKRERQGGG